MEAKKEDKKKGDGSKSEDKDSITGNTADAHVEDTTTTEEFTPPNRTPSIDVHLSETNVRSSNSLRTVQEILSVQPIDDDEFCGNANPTAVSINTANSEEMMTGSHITEFHTSKQEEPAITEFLNKASKVTRLTRKHDAGGGHHNQSNQRSGKLTDYKLNTREDGSFPSNAMGKKDVTKVMG